MPELPEVHTTVVGLNQCLQGLTITDVWSNYNSSFHDGKNNIKNKKYFAHFKESIIRAEFIDATRRGKNILIHLSNGKTILIHMKMTGHLLYGTYRFNKKEWVATEEGPLQDPFNKFIRLIFTFSNGKHLAFSDMRKFAKVFLFDTKNIETHADLKDLGPEPLSPAFTLKKFTEQIYKRPVGKIKQVLMDQTIIAGIGNIYSDEILWEASVHPESIVSKIPPEKLSAIYKAMKLILKKGIDFGGDSMSDYRNIFGERGDFQHKHRAYRLTGKPCTKKGCTGTITRLKIGGRSAHFCNKHQVKY